MDETSDKIRRNEYYEYVMVYVDNVLLIICITVRTNEGIKCVFKLKEDKAEHLDMYLGASLEQDKTKGGTKCWSMSAKKYVKAAAVNLEATLAKRDMQILTSHSPLPKKYRPSEDVSNELNARGFEAYQELIGEL